MKGRKLINLQVVFKAAVGSNRQSNQTVVYVVQNWSVRDALLVIQEPERLRYLPLINIESFYEVENEG